MTSKVSKQTSNHEAERKPSTDSALGGLSLRTKRVAFTREKVVIDKLIRFRLGRNVRRRLTNLIEMEITPTQTKRTKSNYVDGSQAKILKE
jgi:uncharacterized NAD(P)/FAD-binding protein YdhS